MQLKSIFALILGSAGLLLQGCGPLSPYKVPVQQGRILTETQINQVKPGMTEEQVQFLLGTPGIKDVFVPSTWYYVYTHQAKDYPVTEKQLILIFKDDRLVQMNGTYDLPQ